MISEDQARALLNCCESRVGRRLVQLRSRLLGHEDTLGALWELVVLHVVSLAGEVEHEPAEATPDVLLRTRAPRFRALSRLFGSSYRHAVWVEATHIGWQPRDASDRVQAFIRWMRHELSNAGVDPHTYVPQIREPEGDTHLALPPENQWARLRRDDAWVRFIDRVAKREAKDILIIRPGNMNCRVIVTLSDKPNRYATSTFTAPGIIRSISDHPVFRAIKSKANQSKGWDTHDRPVILCVGSSLSTGLFGTPSGSAVSTDAAVLAALHDTSKWHPIHQHNILRDTSGTKYRPSGVSRIAGVVVVSIEDRIEWLPKTHLRRAVTRYYRNDNASCRATDAEWHTIKNLDFNCIVYGPQWESWPRVGRRARSRTRHDRHQPGKQMVYRQVGEGFELEIPAHDLSRLLAGAIDSQGMFAEYDLPGAFKGLIAGPRRIVGVRFVQGDPLKREVSRVCLTFGPPDEPII